MPRHDWAVTVAVLLVEFVRPVAICRLPVRMDCVNRLPFCSGFDSIPTLFALFLTAVEARKADLIHI